jgi:hypothetical protein
VNVGDDSERSPPAELPELSVVSSIEPHNPGREAMRVEIVIEDEIDDSRAVVPFASAEQKGTALMPTFAPLSESNEETTPEPPRAGELMTWRVEEGRNRAN